MIALLQLNELWHVSWPVVIACACRWLCVCTQSASCCNLSTQLGDNLPCLMVAMLFRISGGAGVLHLQIDVLVVCWS